MFGTVTMANVMPVMLAQHQTTIEWMSHIGRVVIYMCVQNKSNQ